MAFSRSTSKPTILPVFSSTLSNGAYVASLPTCNTPPLAHSGSLEGGVAGGVSCITAVGSIVAAGVSTSTSFALVGTGVAVGGGGAAPVAACVAALVFLMALAASAPVVPSCTPIVLPARSAAVLILSLSASLTRITGPEVK